MSFRGQKLKQPMGERFVTVSDISGRMGRWGVTDIREINIPPFISHVTCASWSVKSFVNAACLSQVRVVFKNVPM